MFNGGKYKIASWIKPDEALDSNEQRHSWFKTDFTYKGTGCNIRIAAHNKYKIYINKKRYAAGPCAGNRWSMYWDEFDISPALAYGQNEILIQVISYEPECFDKNTVAGPMSVVSHYISPCLIVNSDNKELVTGSGNWQVCKDQSIKWINQKLPSFTCVGPVENCDFYKSPIDETNESAWGKPIVIGEADEFGFGEHSPFMLKERPIPYLREEYIPFSRQMPIKTDDYEAFEFNNGGAIIPAGSTMVCELDAGELVNAYVQVKAAGAGSIKMTYAECYVNVSDYYYEKGIRDDWETKGIYGFTDVVNIDGKCEYEPFDWKSFRFIRLEISSTDKDIHLQMPKLLTSEYPLTIKGNFSSNEEWTDMLWDISKRTLERCMNDRYMDCPYYERMQYSLDTRLEAMYTYCLSNDTRLAKKAIKDFQATLTPEGMLTSRAPTNRYNVIPNFALHWIMMLEEYYMQTGDKQIVKDNIPSVMAVINWFEKRINSDGLVEAYGYWNFIDWCGDWVDEREVLTGEPEKVKKSGISATNSLMLATALESAIRLLESINRDDTANEYKSLKEYVNSSVIDHCTADDDLLSELPGDKCEITQHAQVWAVLSGVVDAKTGKEILTKSMNPEYPQCTFVMRFFLLRALDKVGLYNEMLEQILKPWKEAQKLNLTTWPEDFARQRSDCHAWSSLPIYEFSLGVLGVRPYKAGFEKILIKPNIINLEFAEGVVPTPKGNVAVRWEKGKEKTSLICSAPQGIPVKVILPNGESDEFVGGAVYNKEF